MFVGNIANFVGCWWQQLLKRHADRCLQLPFRSLGVHMYTKWERSQDSSVTDVTGPPEAHHAPMGSGTHPTNYPLDTWVSLPKTERLEREADHALPPNIEL
jgi:hypothetical protein